MWCDKYSPVNWSQFIGNASAVVKCKNWISAFPGSGKPEDRVLLISGPEGCGKSVGAIMVLAGYKVFRYTLQDIRNHKKDTDLLSNFCHLYTSDLRSVNGGMRHGIVIDDFESLTKAHKVFHAALVDLVVNKGNRNSPPLVLTITAMTAISEKRRRQSYRGLAKIATEVALTGLKQSDVQSLLHRISVYEGIVVGPNVCRLVAEHAHGDIRKAILGFELLAKGKKSVTDELVLDWLDKSVGAAGENEERVVFDESARIKGANCSTKKDAAASDDDRILQVAFMSSDRKAVRTAVGLIQDNSVAFTPLLFQFYLDVSSMSKAAQIAEEFSLSDIIREGSWMGGTSSFGGDSGDDSSSSAGDGDGDGGSFSSFCVDLPIRRMKMLKGIEKIPRIRTSGYESF
jgi:hypothetical protein